VLRSGDDFPTSCQNVDCSTHRPNAFMKHARKPNMQERDHSGNPTSTLEPRIRASNICKKQFKFSWSRRWACQFRESRENWPTLRFRLAPLRRTLVLAESSARQFAPRSQEPSPDTQLGNPSNLVNELLFFGYTFSVVPYQAICGFPPRVHSCRKHWKQQGWYVTSCFLHD
jgi:hypothetical protein